MTPQQTIFHTLLRPCVLQILRAQGYHATRTAVLDSLTDLAARYLNALCQATAHHTARYGGEGDSETPSIVEIRMALEDCGAILPAPVFEEEQFLGKEDTRGVDDFIAWVQGPRNREIKRVALDGDDENNDYLSVLKKKHSKASEDTKYNGTILGKGNDHGEITVEGGQFDSIAMWEEKRRREREQTPRLPSESPQPESRPPSSGLSSLGDRSIDDEMDLS